jgi:hypothetical protein
VALGCSATFGARAGVVDTQTSQTLYVGSIQAFWDQAKGHLPPVLAASLQGAFDRVNEFPPAAEPALVDLSGPLVRGGAFTGFVGNPPSFNTRGLELNSTTPPSVTAEAGSRGLEVLAYRTHSPLLLDFLGVGVREQMEPHPYTFDASRTALFDIDADGYEELVEWPAPSMGILVASLLPKGGALKSLSGLDLLGTVGGFRNGFERLAVFDVDSDGRVAGDELLSLNVWTDANGNAQVDPGELFSPADLGISEISTQHDGVQGSFVQNQQTKTVWDWWPTYVSVRPDVPQLGQPQHLTGKLVQPIPPDVNASVTPQNAGSRYVLPWSALVAYGFNPLESLLVSVDASGTSILLVDYSASPPRTARIWVLARASATSWTLRRFPCPESDIEQIRFDAVGKTVLVVACNQSRLYAITGLDTATGILARIEWDSPSPAFRGAWGSAFVQKISDNPKGSKYSSAGEYNIEGYFHAQGTPLLDAVATTTIDPGTGIDANQDGIVDGSMVTLDSRTNVHLLDGDLLPNAGYAAPYEIAPIAHDTSLAWTAREDGRTALVAIVLDGQGGWQPVELYDGDPEVNLTLTGVGSWASHAAVAYFAPQPSGDIDLVMLQVESGTVTIAGRWNIGAGRPTYLELADSGQQAVWARFNWSENVFRYYTWRAGSSSPPVQLLAVNEPCGSMRVAACAPVYAVQTASRLILDEIPQAGIIPAGSVSGGGWKEVGQPIELTVEGIEPVGAATYQWYRDGVLLPDDIQSTLTRSEVHPEDSGVYYCVVVDESKGVYRTSSSYVTVFPEGSLPAVKGIAVLLLISVLGLIGGTYGVSLMGSRK